MIAAHKTTGLSLLCVMSFTLSIMGCDRPAANIPSPPGLPASKTPDQPDLYAGDWRPPDHASQATRWLYAWFKNTGLWVIEVDTDGECVAIIAEPCFTFTDKDMPFIAAQPRLQSLVIIASQGLTDRGLSQLGTLSQLKRLHIMGLPTRTTAGARSRLLASIPGLQLIMPPEADPVELFFSAFDLPEFQRLRLAASPQNHFPYRPRSAP
jgi:hypothetical protein